MTWRYDERQYRGRKKWLLLGLGLIVVLAAVSTAAMHYRVFKHGPPTSPVAHAAAQKPSEPVPVAKDVTGRYLLNGTVVWARAVEKYAAGNYAQPFSQLDTFNRSAYDAWSTDFECPITNNVVPYETQVNNLIFNCRPEFLPYATKYFNIYDLANNHTDNQGGEVGLDSTRNYLQAAGVQYFGTFDPADSQNVCEVLALPVRIVGSNNNLEQKGSLPVAFCGWHYFYRKPLPGEIAVMDKFAKIMPVFAFVEMGVEYHASADATQVDIAHQVADHNPEFIVANNPHWVQNTEVYHNHLIVYSTGNFIFDQLDAETNRSASIDTTLSVPYDANVAKWLALGPSCAAFHDDCLAKATAEGLTKVNLSLKYGVVAGQNGVRVITHKADAATQAAVLTRMNWTTTCKQLTAPYSCSQ